MTSAIIYYGFRISFSDFWNLTKKQIKKLDRDMFYDIKNDYEHELLREYIDDILKMLKIKRNNIEIIKVDWKTTTNDNFSNKSHFIFGIPLTKGNGSKDFSLSIEKNKDIKKTMKSFKKKSLFNYMKLDYIVYNTIENDDHENDDENDHENDDHEDYDDDENYDENKENDDDENKENENKDEESFDTKFFITNFIMISMITLIRYSILMNGLNNTNL